MGITLTCPQPNPKIVYTSQVPLASSFSVLHLADQLVVISL